MLLRISISSLCRVCFQSAFKADGMLRYRFSPNLRFPTIIFKCLLSPRLVNFHSRNKMNIDIRLLLFFIALIVSTTGKYGECPPDRLIHPCVCDYGSWFSAYQPGTVKCEKVNSVSDIEDVISRSYDHPMSGLHLKEDCMLYLPSTLLSSKNTQLLAIEGSVFVSLFDKVPDQENAVVEVFLVEVRLMRGIQWDHFQTFTKLEKIFMQSVEVPALGESFRAHMSRRLTDLTMESTNTRRIHDEAFHDMTQLRVLRIMNSQVSTLRRSMFAKPSLILYFDFSGNRLQSLPADLFDDMPQLTKVWLTNNKIKILSEVTFDKLLYGDPIYFDLTDNPLECTCNIQWILKRPNGLRFLGKCNTPINMAGRQLQDLEAKDFDYCPRSPTAIM